MTASGPWRPPAGLCGNIACGLATAGDGRRWASVLSAGASPPPRRCRVFAECVDAQLNAFGYGWRPGSIRPLRAQAHDPPQPLDPHIVDVLRANTSLIASFACPLEAVRYAALLHEPGCAPLLRRRRDGAMKAFSPTASIPETLRWLKPGSPHD